MILNTRIFTLFSKIGATVVAYALLALVTSQAFSESHRINAQGGVAIHGYDPVSYFTEDKPIKGNPDIAMDWSGATWHFASEDNREKFEKNPESYAPQYGGFCAFAVSNGAVADIDPQAWTIYDNKLYLNFNLQVRDMWNGDRENHIISANRNWPGLSSGQ